VNLIGAATFIAAVGHTGRSKAEASYKRTVKDQQAGAPARKVGASATPERA
jgi:hypothetical protein